MSSDIGIRCELLAMKYLLESGYNVATPFGNHLPYDLIAEQGGVCWKIQVKGSSTCARRNVTKLHYSKKQVYTADAVDYFMVVHTEHIGVWYCIPAPCKPSLRLSFVNKGPYKVYLNALPQTRRQDELL